MTLDAEILRALRSDRDGVSGGELSARLGVSRSTVGSRIEGLRAAGYEIVSSPHIGYRLLAAPNALNTDDLLSRLPDSRIVGRQIQVFRETTSTNDVVLRLARSGAAEGAVVFAESQSHGRGRLGRNWISPFRKGLWFSVLLRPSLRPQAATRITIAAATALARAVEGETGLEPVIKWPNDLMVSGRKAAGILTEIEAGMDRVQFVILGIGVDVNQTAQELPVELKPIATSLRIECGERVDRIALAARILRELDADYRRICGNEFASVADEWEDRCGTLGRGVVIRMGDRRIQGRAESLNADGALQVRTDHGHLETVIGGDVTLEK